MFKWEGMTKQERWGMIALLALILFSITIWQVIDYVGANKFSKKEKTQIQKDWESFQANHITWDSNAQNTNNNEAEQGFYPSSNQWEKDEVSLKQIAYQPVKFDPNTASIETMIASGVPISSAKRIIKYRNKGGQFFNAEKLLNFGFSEADLTKVTPYLVFPNKNNSYSNNNNYRKDYPQYKNNYTPTPEPTQVFINTTNEEELMKFKGIGPGFSKRIINYRNKLGGFLSIEQLKEVYGLPDSTYNHIKDKIVIEPDKIIKININTSTEAELANHPYIGKYMAANIIKLRNDIKSFKNIAEIRQVPLINEEKYRKIVPYIQL